MRAKPRKAGKPLGEEQAWQVIEAIFERRTGVCKAIDDLRNRGLISERTYHEMHARVRAAKPADNEPSPNSVWFLGVFVKDYTRVADQPRQAFARKCRDARRLGRTP